MDSYIHPVYIFSSGFPFSSVIRLLRSLNFCLHIFPFVPVNKKKRKEKEVAFTQCAKCCRNYSVG